MMAKATRVVHVQSRSWINVLLLGAYIIAGLMGQAEPKEPCAVSQTLLKQSHVLSKPHPGLYVDR